MPVRHTIHRSILLSGSSGALSDVRLEEEMDEQNQIRAEEPASEQRSIFGTCTVGGLGHERWEEGAVACFLTCG